MPISTARMGLPPAGMALSAATAVLPSTLHGYAALTIPPPTAYAMENEPSLRAWWDGQTPSTITTTANGLASQWASRVNGYVLGQPGDTLPEALPNGVKFQVNGTKLTIASRLGLSTSNTSVSVVACLLSRSFGTRFACTIGSYTASGNGTMSVIATRRYSGCTILPSTSYLADGAPDTSPYLFTLRYDSAGVGSSDTRINGTIAINATSSGTAPFGNANEQFAMGVGSPVFAGDVYGLAVFNSADLSVIQKAEGVLAHRHGIAGLLPLTHPYKTAPPA